MKKLTVLSFGAGQDSTTILLKLIFSKVWLSLFVGDRDLIVIMADTGNEHSWTYDNVRRCRKLCEDNGIPFFFLDKEAGFHTPAWLSLVLHQTNSIRGSEWKETMVQLNMKSCTDKLKLVPIYKFLDEYVNEKYGYGFPIASTRGCGKKAIMKYQEEYGDIEMMIGFARGEDKRLKGSIEIERKQKLQTNKNGTKNWQAAITRIYPLVTEGLDRADCQRFLEKVGFGDVMPSNCMMCPYQSDAEILWLFRNEPKEWEQWVEIENRHFKRWTGVAKKVRGTKLDLRLPQILERAQAKYGHLTDTQLHEYKKSHGCETNIF